jgi:hypothetical protein
MAFPAFNGMVRQSSEESLAGLKRCAQAPTHAQYGKPDPPAIASLTAGFGPAINHGDRDRSAVSPGQTLPKFVDSDERL